MFRTILALLLLLIGLAGIALGVWGFSLDPENEMNEAIGSAAADATNFFQKMLGKLDDFLSDLTNSNNMLEKLVNEGLSSASGSHVDVTNSLSLALFAAQYALVILLCGIISTETGLLLLKWGS